MSVTIIDTDILIEPARQAREAIACLDEIEQRSTLAISVITQMELIAQGPSARTTTSPRLEARAIHMGDISPSAAQNGAHCRLRWARHRVCPVMR